MMNWEEARKKFGSKTMGRPEPSVCVCGHSKYHHTYDTAGTAFMACLDCQDCVKYELLIFNTSF